LSESDKGFIIEIRLGAFINAVGRLSEMTVSEVFICDAVRTPFGRFGGALSTVRADDLAAIPIRALMERNAGMDWSAVDDVIYGCANQAGEDNRNVARMALLLAGMPKEVPGATVNRLCGSSMEAVSIAARAIKSGEAELMIAGGVESMTRAPFVMGKSDKAFSRDAQIYDTTIGWRFVNPMMKSKYGVDSMPETAENVAEEYHVGRQDQDAFAMRTQQRWARAHAAGFFKCEIVAVPVAQAKGGEPKSFDTDEQPRPDTTMEGLQKLKPIVKPGGTVTAGNASGINDGACALLLASKSAVEKYRLAPRARVLATATAGVAPRVMGFAPSPASRKVLAKTGLKISQMDVIELNEAFAAQALAVMRDIGLPDDAAHVNPNGGAIAIGHPLGASGARLITTAMYQLQSTGGRYALCTMCIGVGQGIATIIERC
jgi:acetyl-CoA acyltransferase